MYNGQLTSITHYYKFCYVEDIVKRKEEIARQLKTFFDEKVKGKIPTPHYVCDFAILDSGETILIEVNPFVTYFAFSLSKEDNTSSALFSWELDREQLKGEGKWELRILEHPPDNPRSFLGPFFTFLLEELRPTELPKSNKDKTGKKDKDCIIN